MRRLLSEARLVTMVGPGGVGKTRLALRAAADLRRLFPDGTAVADLSAVREAALVVQQVAAALDVPDVSGRWLTAGLSEVVGDRHLLLVLDNCEQVRDASAVLVHSLLTSCPRLRVLATSRRPLNVDGEVLLAVPPMSTPPTGSPEELLASDAVRLLEQRARAVAPGLDLTSAHAGDLAELCRRLDGLPLAIELAAVRLRTLSPAEVVSRLDDRFRLLRRSGTTAPERHRTLRATMEWSLELLAGPERVLWRRAAVFAGDFGLEPAEVVCADEDLPQVEVLDALEGLVDASVLEASPGPLGARFRMLETVRAFGLDLLAASGEEPLVRRRHRDWCSHLAASTVPEFIGANQVAAFDRLADVHPQISAALAYCLDTPGEEPTGLGMAADLWLYWEARGHLGEGRRWLEALLRLPQPPAVRARGLAAAGYLALAATDPGAAVPLLEEARDLGTETGQKFVTAMATQYLGQAALFRGELDAADRGLREAAALHQELDARYAAFCWADIGVVALLAGSLAAAVEAFDRSLALNEGGDPWTRSHALWGLGLAQLRRGDARRASEHARDALRLMRAVDDRSGSALCVGALAWAAAARGEWEHTALLSGAAEAIWRSIPAELPAPLAGYRDEYEARARRALGDRRWASRYGEGSALDRTAAVSLALGDRPAVPSPREPAGTGTGDTLTGRQRQVAELIAQGLTDREIAARLVISPRTAESHVQQILTRLGFRSRAEIAAWTTARQRQPPRGDRPAG